MAVPSVAANKLCSRLHQRIGTDERDVEKAKWWALRRYAKTLAVGYSMAMTMARVLGTGVCLRVS
jgi:hypothetical protein